MTDGTSRFVSRLVARVTAIRTSHVGLVAGVGITVFVVLGILQRTLYPTWTAANLDSEASVATWFAATLLWVAAIYWALLATTKRPRAWPTVAWSAVLVLLALDEGNGFHEAVERGTGIDWQILYLPVMGIAAFAWWRVVRQLSPSPTATLLIAGAGAWVVTLALELVQHWGGTPIRATIYDPAMITEEALEMIGSTFILMAGLSALRVVTKASDGTPDATHQSGLTGDEVLN